MSSGSDGGGKPSGKSNGNANNRTAWHGPRQQQVSTTRIPSEDLLNGHCFDMGDGSTSSEQFIRTKLELETYVGRHFKEYTSDLVQSIRDMNLVDPTEPEVPVGEVRWADQEKWKRADKECHKRTMAYVDFRAGLYGIVWGQCYGSAKE